MGRNTDESQMFQPVKKSSQNIRQLAASLKNSKLEKPRMSIQLFVAVFLHPLT